MITLNSSRESVRTRGDATAESGGPPAVERQLRERSATQQSNGWDYTGSRLR